MNFLLTDGSSYNTVENNVASTGDFFGYVVADPFPGTLTLATYGPSDDNVVSSNVSHSDGPPVQKFIPVSSRHSWAALWC